MSKGLQLFARRDIGRTFFYEREGLRMYAALVNAMHALRGVSEVFGAKQKLLSKVRVGGSPASLPDSVQYLKMRLEPRKFKDTSIRSFKQITLNLDHILVVRLFCKPQLDHPACVDTKRGLTVDRCERYPMILTRESLVLFAGVSNECSRVGEVQELGIRSCTQEMIVLMY